MKIHKKLWNEISTWFKEFIILMERFKREKKEIPKEEETKEKNEEHKEDNNDLKKEALNKEDTEEISSEARRFIKNLLLEKDKQRRRGNI